MSLATNLGKDEVKQHSYFFLKLFTFSFGDVGRNWYHFLHQGQLLEKINATLFVSLNFLWQTRV
jgi:hypothetical protein